MTQRAESLAQRFENANNEFIALIERSDDGQWRTPCQAEGWALGVGAAHIAEDHELLVNFVKMVANGATLPNMTIEDLNQHNAQQAGRNARRTKEETLELLRSNGAAASTVIRGLSDAQLDSAALVPETNPIRVLEGLPERITAQDLVEAVMIYHIEEHGSSIRATIGATAKAAVH